MRAELRAYANRLPLRGGSWPTYRLGRPVCLLAALLPTIFTRVRMALLCAIIRKLRHREAALVFRYEGRRNLQRLHYFNGNVTHSHTLADACMDFFN